MAAPRVLSVLMSLVLFLEVNSQPKSAVEFYDTTGTDPTARIGWQGTRTAGKLFIETPPGTEAVSVQGRNLTVAGEVRASSFRGDGSSLTGVAPATHTHTLSEIVPNGVFSADIRDSAVTSAKIRDGTITDADIAEGAAIAGRKIRPVFGNIKILDEYDDWNNAPYSCITMKVSPQDSFMLRYLGKSDCPIFDLAHSKSWVGAASATFHRLRPGKRTSNSVDGAGLRVI